MTRALLKRGIGKLAAVLLALATIAGIGQFVVHPLASRLTTAQERIGTARQLLGRLKGATADETQVVAARRRLAELQSSGIFIEGETPAIRAANLQSLVEESASRLGIRLSSTRIVPPVERDGQDYLGLRIEFLASLDRVQSLLLDLETRRPWLWLDTVDLTTSGSAAGRNVGEQPLVEAGLTLLAATKIRAEGGTP